MRGTGSARNHHCVQTRLVWLMEGGAFISHAPCVMSGDRIGGAQCR